MRILLSDEEFNSCRTNDMIPMECECCGKRFTVRKHYVVDSLNRHGGKYYRYCSHRCRNISEGRRIETVCAHCGKTIYKTLREYSKSSNHFCDSSCAASYNNAHKKSGCRRSRLEEYLEMRLRDEYPDMDILFNDRSVIGAELDIYIPSIRTGFEINGIVHYKPIYGDEKWERVVSNDEAKRRLCESSMITLHVVDTSSQKRFDECGSAKYFNYIRDRIEEKKGAAC